MNKVYIRSAAGGLAACLAALVLSASLGCGKKTWPAPKAVKERFHIVHVDGEYRRGCLHAQARLDGKWENLSELILEISDPESECPGCPFSPAMRISFTSGSPQLSREEEHIELVYCGRQPEPPYRFRLVGKNIYDILGDTASDLAKASAPGFSTP